MPPKKVVKKGPAQGSILSFFSKNPPKLTSTPQPAPAVVHNASPSSDASIPDSISSRVSRGSTSKHFKRKARPDSDSEPEPNELVAYVPMRHSPSCSRAILTSSPTQSDKENMVANDIPTRPMPLRKKARTASPCPSPRPPPFESDEIPVPSSQSDEDELMPIASALKNEQSRPSTPLQPHTPSRTGSMLSEPQTPVALSPGKKTAQIIAEIKARVQANAAAEETDDEEDQPLRELRELSDSSDDEELGEVNSRTVLNAGPSTASPIAPRYSLRDRNAKRVASSSRKTPTPPPPPKKVDPFAALLKEKRNAERLGTDNQAFLRAEEIVRVGSPLTDMADDDENWADEAAALAAVKAFADSSDGFDEGAVDLSINYQDQRRLLGDKAGKEVAQILGNDRARREAAKGKQRVIGVPLWESSDESMEVDSVSFSLWREDINASPVLNLLRSCFESADHYYRASMLLNSGVLGRMNLNHSSDVVSCLLQHALSSSPLGPAAFNALSSIWNHPSTSASTVPFDTVLLALHRVGAKPEVFAAMGWETTNLCKRDNAALAQRNEILFRLVRLVNLSAQSTLPPSEDIPDVASVLLVVAMDPSIRFELRRDIMVVIGLLCRRLGPEDTIPPSEAVLGRKILGFAATLQSHNQSHLLALVADGSERGRRIARWVSHALLTSTLEPEYSGLPPLTAIYGILFGERKSIFQLNDETDYVELVTQVSLLAHALSNVDGYVKQEMQEAPPSPSKVNGDKPETILSRIRLVIETIHGSIIDTRAARLDRSRAKAALKQLSMRIHYQHEVALRSARGARMGRPGIKHYFAKNS